MCPEASRAAPARARGWARPRDLSLCKGESLCPSAKGAPGGRESLEGGMITVALIVAAVLAARGLALAAPVVQLDAWGRDSIRVRIAPAGGTGIVDPPFSPLLLPGPPPQASPRPPASSVALTNGNLALVVDPATGFITASRVSDGAQLWAMTALSFGAAAPGASAGAVSAAVTLTPGPGATKLVGMGEIGGWARLDKTGIAYNMTHTQQNTDAMVPFYAAWPVGWGFLWALPSYGEYSLMAGAHTWTSLATHCVDFWVTTTPGKFPPAPPPADPAASSPLAPLLANLADAVGHAAPLPRYVAGFWQCKNRYRNQTQLLDVARGYVQRGLPIDIITIDYLHWPKAFGDWSFDPACWPDPQGMVSELRALGIELAVTFWAHVDPVGSHFAAFNASGLLARNLSTDLQDPVTDFYGPLFLTDTTQSAARAAMFQAFMDGYGKYGVRTVWLDAAEPARSAYAYGMQRYAGGVDNEVGMAWVQQHVRAFSDGFAAAGRAPNEFFLLPRSTWAGMSRYSAGMWSGDIGSDFNTLAVQVVVGQAVSLSGIAAWTNDAGGYAGGDPADPQFQELIVRWLQASAFFPVMRLHGRRSGGRPA